METICEPGRHRNCIHTRRKPSASASRGLAPATRMAAKRAEAKRKA